MVSGMIRRTVITVLGAMAALGAALAGRGLQRRRAAIAQVPRDLRGPGPFLYLPLSIRNRAGLALVRASRVLPVRTPPDIHIDHTVVPGSGAGPGVAVVTYERIDRGRPSAALVWMHGGGYVGGSPSIGHATACRFARELGIVVVSVDYRLAPEHPFPQGLEDCYAALAWVHGNASTLGVDPERIAVGGDSAGGGLAAALGQVARDRKGPPVAFQLLLYPMLDDRTVLEADHGGRGAFVWTPTSNRYGWTAYLGRPPADDAPAYAAPARMPDLAGLPPAWIGVGDLDLFYLEDIDYAHRLRAAGVACELHVEPGLYHAADRVAPRAAASRAIREGMVDALGSGLATSAVRRGP